MANKTDIAKQIAKDNQMTVAKSQELLDIAFSAFKKTLTNNKRVQLMGLGTFEKKTTKAHAGHNPRTGQLIQIPTKTSIKFKISQELKNKIN